MASLFTKIAMAGIVAAATFVASAPAQAGGIDVDIRLRRPHHRLPHAPIMILPAERVVIRRAPVVVIERDFGRCSPNQALNKAFDNGLNRPTIANITQRRVTVQGRIRGMVAKISFANVRGCPRI